MNWGLSYIYAASLTVPAFLYQSDMIVTI